MGPIPPGAPNASPAASNNMNVNLSHAVHGVHHSDQAPIDHAGVDGSLLVNAAAGDIYQHPTPPPGGDGPLFLDNKLADQGVAELTQL